jgi:Zinc carboxypeptidase
MKTQSRTRRRMGTALSLILLVAVVLSVSGTSAAPNRLPPTPVDPNVTTPLAFLGYEIGQDYKLTPWQERELEGEGMRKGIVDYAHELDRTSDRVQVFEYGQSEEGRPMILTVITSPENWAQIDDLKGILAKLGDPRQTSDAEAKALASQGKAVYWMVAAIHATERTSPEVLLRLSYHLASDQDQWTKDLLDDVIVVIENTVNPDGLDWVTDWYYKYKDTPYLTSSPPYYNKYINHDNNRDYLGLGMVESQQNAAVRTEWHPTVFHDLHQAMVMLYITPGPDPTNDAISPITVGEWLGFAGHTMAGLIAKGWTGVFTYDYASMWYPGFMNSFTSEYNSYAMFYELQGANYASPRTQTQQGRSRTWYNPAPIKPPFPWKLMDAVNLEEDALRLSLGYAQQNKEELLYNFYLKGKRNMEQALSAPPYAYVIPANGGDNADVTDMINNLRAHLFEISQATAPFTVDGRQVNAGDYVLSVNQPYGFLLKNLLGVQTYPLPQAFDVTAWTYGLLRDVETVEVNTLLPDGLPLAPLAGPVSYAGSLTGAVSTQYVLEHRSNNNLAKALPLLWADADFTLAQADAPFTAGGMSFPAGTFIVGTTGSQADHDALAALAQQYGLTIFAVSEALTGAPLHQPHVGLYTPNNSTSATMPEGWVRMLMDRTGFPYTRLYPLDVANGDLSGYDVIIVPDMSVNTLINGSSTSQTTPPEYRPGIGSTGVANLKGWVEAGGTLVTMSRASMMPIQQGWPVGVALPSAAQPAMAAEAVEPEPEAGQEEDPVWRALTEGPGAGKAAAAVAAAAPQFSSPGAIVRIGVDPSKVVGYGYDAEEASWGDNAIYYTVDPGSSTAAVASYPTTGPILLSGYAANVDSARGQAVVADAPMGAGNVVMIGPNVLYRAQATRTYMFFWNAVLEGGR